MELRKHVVLTPGEMNKSLIGMEVTLDIRSETGSRFGVIENYDDENIHIKISGKVQKLPYDPSNIILKVYQFDKGIKFCCQSELDAIENKKDDSDQEVKESKPNPEKPKPKKSKKASALKQIEW